MPGSLKGKNEEFHPKEGGEEEKEEERLCVIR
jgi:hypothetical protein